MDLLRTLAPEAALASLALLQLLLAAARPRHHHPESPEHSSRVHRLQILGALLVAILSALSLQQEGTLFGEAYRVDGFSQLFKLITALGFLGVQLLMGRDPTLDRRDAAERRFLMACSALGLMAMVSAVELITLYIALELSSYPLYALVAQRRRHGRAASEAAMKYFFVGAVASAITVFGISLLYANTGTTAVGDIAAKMETFNIAGWVGLFLTLAGFLFKLGVAPVHAWVADVYDGAANGVATFVAVVTKAAAVAVLLRLTVGLAGHEAGGAMRRTLGWLAVLSMTVGNLTALAQTDLKRLLGWSAVAQAGYLMAGVMAANHLGATSVAFYAAGYALMSLLVFAVVMTLGQGENVSLEDLRGLHRRSPFLALCLLIGVLGLGGVPPAIGFTGKWLLFQAAMGVGAWWVVLLAAINNTVSLYYYLRVVKAAYVDEAGPAGFAPISVPSPWTLVLTVSLLAVVVLGCLPAPLWGLADAAARALGYPPLLP